MLCTSPGFGIVNSPVLSEVYGSNIQPKVSTKTAFNPQYCTPNLGIIQVETLLRTES